MRAVRWTLAIGLSATVIIAAIVTWTYEPGPAPAQVGDPGAPFRLPVVGTDPPHELGLDDFRGKGVVLNVWATWCEPCLAELPLLASLQTRYGGQHLQVVGVTDDDPLKVIAFLKEHPQPFPVLLDAGGALRTKLGADVLPYTIFIGPDGTIAGKKVGQLRETQAIPAVERLIIAARKFERAKTP